MNRATAIRKYCLDCGDTPKGVKDCSFTNCPLYPFRLKKGGGSKTAPVRKYCLVDCMNNNSIEVKECVNKECFLYPFRMGSSKIQK